MSKNKQPKKPGVKVPLATTQAWQQFGLALAGTLSELGEDEFLVISAKATGHFVQFAGQGVDGVRAEAQSNAFIEAKEHRLSKRTRQLLLDLGWNGPTYAPATDAPEPAEGSCNYYLDVPTPVSFETLAQLAVATLRQVYGVPLPDELIYMAFSDLRASLRFPRLEIQWRSLDDPSPETEISPEQEPAKGAGGTHKYVFYPSLKRLL